MQVQQFREALTSPGERIIVAYDGLTWPQIVDTSIEVSGIVGIGKTNSAHVRAGADHAVGILQSADQELMLDSKFHDIPQTVHDSVENAVSAGAKIVTVHASGGSEMLAAAVVGRDKALDSTPSYLRRVGIDRTAIVLGITVLTSLEDEAYSIFGLDFDDEDAIKKKVIQFADMSQDAGIDGVVCSPLEARALRDMVRFDDFLVVTPGITPRYATKAHDQKRTATPEAAMQAGVDLIVVGRGIIKAGDYGLTRAEATREIAMEISGAIK